MEARYAQVHVLDILVHLDMPYTYRLTEEQLMVAAPGDFVVVPFGGGNRRRFGLIVSISSQTELSPSAIKPVIKLLPRLLRLSEEQLQLCAFMKEQTLCTMGDAARTLLPAGAGMLGHLEERYFASFEKPLEKQGVAGWIMEQLQAAQNGLDEMALTKLLGQAPAKSRVLQELLRDGYVEKRAIYRDGEQVPEMTLVSLQIDVSEARLLVQKDPEARRRFSLQTRSDKYERALRLLLEQDEVSADELKELCDLDTAGLRLLEQRGIVTLRRVPKKNDPYADFSDHAVAGAPVVLNEEQQTAFDTLRDLCNSGEAHAALLYGVTGSGKTNVIRALIDAVTEQRRQAILLVPEISLTPQSVAIFCSFYRGRVAVFHSGLNATQRMDAWRRCRTGEVDLVIGTRSAVFAPLPNIGLIVLDEEQEHTYKSDQNPKYHARDIARFRCAWHGATMLLASATPSPESFYRACSGKYTLLRLTKRYGNATLPKVTLADLRTQQDLGEQTHLSTTLIEAIQTRLTRGEQSILFVNRRGYHNYLSCMRCGEVLMCPHCSVSLTQHRAKNGGAFLMCHYCGYQIPKPETCPQCGSEHLRHVGFGTQHTQQMLQKTFPQVRILRMDGDTTQTKFAHDKILQAFRRHEADILLGTQMVTKGHDFPDVTLVGVLDADSLLYLNDYRAAEKAFSLLTQVIGRAGRAEKPGEAIIQTFHPDHPTLRLAMQQDYEPFYEETIAMRRALVFPPFCDIVQLTVLAREEQEARRGAKTAAEIIGRWCAKDGEYHDVPIVLFGPFEAPVFRINEKYRMRLVMKCKCNKRARAMFYSLLCDSEKALGQRVSVGIDINPTTL